MNGKLGSAALVPATNTILYTVPVDISFTALNINILNASNGAAKIRIAISATSIFSLKDYIEYDVVLAPKGILERTGIICGTGEIITVYSDVANVIARVHGAEESAYAVSAVTAGTGGVGSIGPMGPEGPIGLTGPMGLSGAAGLPGLPGPTGATGDIGPAGATGPAGINGATGAASTVAGPIGPQGIQGDIGLTGATGATGPVGPDGIQGFAGSTGPVGPAGADGLQGTVGLTGPQGIQGNIGLTGNTGPAGAAGSVVVSPGSIGSYSWTQQGTNSLAPGDVNYGLANGQGGTWRCMGYGLSMVVGVDTMSVALFQRIA